MPVGEYQTKLGLFEQCPECHHLSYYPFSDGWMCILCECVGAKPKQPQPEVEAEQPMSKNQRRKANQRARREAAKNGVDA